MPLPINNNVTRIEDLPELSDIENSFGKGGKGGRGRDDDVMSIRSSDFSGMSGGNEKITNKYIRKLTRDNHQNTPYESSHYVVEQPRYEEEMFDEPRYQEMFEKPSQAPSRPFTCLDVCNHIKGCPLCSKFYNNDNSLYIIIIIALLILVIILTKKVLNV